MRRKSKPEPAFVVRAERFETDYDVVARMMGETWFMWALTEPRNRKERYKQVEGAEGIANALGFACRQI